MKYPHVLYKYQGSDQSISNMLFVRQAEFCAGKDGKPTKEKWPSDSEKWKFDLGDRDVFLVSVENHFQPPHIQKNMCEVKDLENNDVEITSGIPAVSWCGSKEDFERDFKKVGSK